MLVDDLKKYRRYNILYSLIEGCTQKLHSFIQILRSNARKLIKFYFFDKMADTGTQ